MQDKLKNILILGVVVLAVIAAITYILPGAAPKTIPTAPNNELQKPAQLYTSEQQTALQEAKALCDTQCQLEQTYALAFGAKPGAVDGFPRTQSKWCSTTFNIIGVVENCYQIGATCSVTDANSNTCSLMCDGTTAKCA